jgi:hypothetical protein
MVQVRFPMTDEAYQRLRQVAQQKGESIESVLQEMVNASLLVTLPEPYPYEESRAILKRISGSLSILGLDVNQHDRYVAGLEDSDDSQADCFC